MKYAYKVYAKIPDLNTSGRDLISEHGRLKRSKFYSLKRFKFGIDEALKFVDVLPQIKDYCVDSSLTNIKLLLPHVHTGPRHIIINFYMGVSGEKTSFWQGKIKHDDRYIEDQGNGYVNVNPDLIDPVESFTAQDGDIWAIDPFTTHSVLPTIDTEKSIIKRMVSGFDRRVAVKAIRSNRSIVQLFYDLTLEEAIEKLNGKL